MYVQLFGYSLRQLPSQTHLRRRSVMRLIQQSDIQQRLAHVQALNMHMQYAILVNAPAIMRQMTIATRSVLEHYPRDIWPDDTGEMKFPLRRE